MYVSNVLVPIGSVASCRFAIWCVVSVEPAHDRRKSWRLPREKREHSIPAVRLSGVGEVLATTPSCVSVMAA